MFSFSIATTPALFTKFFAAVDREATLAAIPSDTRRVLFVDTPSTPELAETVKALVELGVEVHVRDHHRGEGRNPEAAEAVEAVLGGNARIVDRKTSPGCAVLVELGEFTGEGTVIVADPDLDGLTASMKAAGVSYEGLEQDAEIFDVRPKQSAETLTPLGWTVVRALSTLPSFNPQRPEIAENAKAELFQSFVKAASGDAEARAGLEAKVAAYEAGVAEAKRLAEGITSPCAQVSFVDTCGAPRHDLNTLTQAMEATGCKVTVVRKDAGPIAAAHRVQYSLAVVRKHQEEIDLRNLVPEGSESSPKAGIISNTSFLLHCSEKVWEEVILPALRVRFG
ncbi:MAG: hypothetical protein P1P90_04220 [Patescibacteria group bacterium]|nr:hypothetical protein [Patescibacteria group bacterium]